MVLGTDNHSRGYTIRPASAEDVEFLPEIEQRASELFASTPFSDEVSQECLSVDFLTEQCEAGRLWVAADDYDIPVGFSAAIIVDGNAHLHEVSVDPAHVKQGLGRRLIEAVINWAKAEHRLMTLSTFYDIPWNAPFYAKLGFREFPESEHGPEMKELREEERDSGLDTSRRLIMYREL